MFRTWRLLTCILWTGLVGGGSFLIIRYPHPNIARPDIPSEVRAQPGRMVVIRTTSEAPIRWHRCPSTNEPDMLPLDDGKTLIFVAAQPGRYELWAWSAVGNQPTEAAQCSVIVGEPTPPTPPDTLIETLRAAWQKETGLARLQHRDALVRVYRQAADDLVRQSNLTTLNELYSAIRTNAVSVLPNDALLPIRTAIGEVLRQRLPTVDGPLNEDLRKRCAEAFRAVAVALEKLEGPQVKRIQECVNCR